MGDVKKRIQLIDALRGLSILLMVAYHAGYDLVAYGYLPERVLFNPLLDVLQPLFAGVFIVLSGVSSRFSRDNLRRGTLTLFCGVLVSVAGGFFGVNIPFGILHFLGLSMLIFGLVSPLWDKIPQHLQPVLSGGLFFVCCAIFPLRSALFDGVPYLYALGLIDESFWSPDYYGLLPWIFLFFFGTWLGTMIRQNRLPSWFYTVRVPFLPAVGRHTLAIYLVHQPVLMVVFWAIRGGE